MRRPSLQTVTFTMLVLQFVVVTCLLAFAVVAVRDGVAARTQAALERSQENAMLIREVERLQEQLRDEFAEHRCSNEYDHSSLLREAGAPRSSGHDAPDC